jgi:hypothetical protein
MANYNLIKGDKLEKAVCEIEKLILRVAGIASLRQYEVIIKPKHIEVIDGARYEIDLLVDLKNNYGYNSRYIFECKNVEKEKVGRSEISIFKDKIEVFNATEGFLVGTKFTKDAVNKANSVPKISIVKAKYIPDLIYNPKVRLENWSDEKSRDIYFFT